MFQQTATLPTSKNLDPIPMLQSKDNKALTSIRGIASLWVVGHHWLASTKIFWLATVFGAGSAAVDLFFILSGLILATVYKKINKSDVLIFYVKRIFRVWPLHIVALIVLVAVVGPIIFKIYNFKNFDFLASVFLLQSYFNLSAVTNPPSWSISIELLCYALFPIYLLIIGYICSNVISTFFLLFMFILLYLIFQNNYIHATEGFPAVCRGTIGFLLGMCIFQAKKFCFFDRKIVTGIEIIGSLGIILSIAFHRQIFITTFSAILLFGLAYDKGIVANLLNSKLLVWLGEISFSMYLLHHPLILAANKWFRVDQLLFFNNYANVVRYSALIVFLLFVANFSYQFIEKTFRKLPNRIFLNS